MGVLSLNWNSENTALNPSVTGQRISKRIKAIGGAWDTAGFDEPNDMNNSQDDNLATVTDNRVYEFLLESLCSEGGPVQVLNGIQEGIAFACIEPEIQATHSAALVTVPLAGTDISKVRVTLRKQSDDSIVNTSTAVNGGTQVQFNFSGLTEEVGYYVDIELYANVNGVEVISSGAEFLNGVCSGGAYEFTTSAQPDSQIVFAGFGNSVGAACGNNTEVYIPDSPEGIEEGVTIYVDSGLTTPVTGYSYVRTADGRVYEINNLTGLVGELSESNCGGTMVFNNLMGGGNIMDAPPVGDPFYYLQYGSFPLGSGSAGGIHGPYTGDIAVPLTLTEAAVLTLLVNGGIVDTAAALTNGTYTLTGTFTASDNVEIKLDEVID